MRRDLTIARPKEERSRRERALTRRAALAALKSQPARAEARALRCAWGYT